MKSQSFRVVIRHVAVAVFIVSLAALRNTNAILTVAFGPVAASASHGKVEEVVCRARVAFGILEISRGGHIHRAIDGAAYAQRPA